MSVVSLEEKSIQKRREWKTRASLALGRWPIRGVALSYLALLLMIPLIVIFQDGFREGLGGLWHQITLPIAWHALQLTLWTSAVMTVINTIMGTLTAYVLVRYDFRGKTLLNSLVDVPLEPNKTKNSPSLISRDRLFTTACSS